MPRIAFATCAEYADLTADDRLAVDALSRMGIDVVPWIWDRPAPHGVALTVIRSCWDYHRKTQQFRTWLQTPTQRLLNPAASALWNLDKRYLRDLAAQNHVVPRMVTLEQSAVADLGALLRQAHFDEAVVKPMVGMLGIDTFRVRPDTACALQPELDRILADRGVMIQEFVREVLTEGEISLMFIGGEFSHAIRKRPGAGEFRIQEEYGGRREPFDPPSDMISQARGLLADIGGDLLYARVDGIPHRGALVLMEVELIDPHMFLGYDALAPRRFAQAVAARM